MNALIARGQRSYEAVLDSLRGKFGDVIDDRAVRAHLDVTKAIVAVVDGRDPRLLDEEVEEYLELSGKSYRRLRPTQPVSMLKERIRVANRAETLSVLYTADADQDEDVQAFRTNVLDGKSLRKEQVGDWIKKHDAGSTCYVEIPLPEGARSAFDKKSFSFRLNRRISGPVTSVKTKFLDLWSESGWVNRVPTRLGSVLDRLRILSERLSLRYPWQKAQASLFVLAGTVPLVAGLRSSFDLNVSRVALDVDIVTTPRELADFYRRAKKNILKGRRTKTLDLKHTRLALYSADAEGFKKWNKENGKWRYKEIAIFRRDCIQARKRLLKPLGELQERLWL